MVYMLQWQSAQILALFDIDGLVQDCSNSIANALELLQSCTKPSICGLSFHKQEYSTWMSD